MFRAVVLWLCCASAFAGTANLSWTAPTQHTDGTPITAPLTYRVYERCNSGVQTQVGQTTALTLTRLQPDDGRTCWWALTAADNTGESAKTNEISKTFAAAPIPVPGDVSATFVWQVIEAPPTPAFAQGFDFRATAGFVVDPPGSVFVCCQYTAARGWGWAGQGIPGPRDRSASGDPRTAGVQQITNGPGAKATFRVDLPGPGTYKITLAVGDRSYGQEQFVRLLDGATVFRTYTVVTPLNQFMAANGVVGDWTVPLEHTFVSNYFQLEIGGNGATSTTVAHLKIESK